MQLQQVSCTLSVNYQLVHKHASTTISEGTILLNYNLKRTVLCSDYFLVYKILPIYILNLKLASIMKRAKFSNSIYTKHDSRKCFAINSRIDKKEYVYFSHNNEPRYEISNNVLCATNKGSHKPAHTRSLIRAFASRLTIL